MLTYVEDISLFKSPAQTLVNTVNTVGVMGKGIAAEFKKRYPQMYEEYRKLCHTGKLKIGTLHVYRTPNKIIINFPTKKHWRARSQVEYIEKGLKKFVKRYMDFGIFSVSFPQLGCGHGELDWENQVKPIMESHLAKLPISVYIHLYPTPLDFVPERVDPQYAREVLLERQQISIDQLWGDLRVIIKNASSVKTELSLFTPKWSMSDDQISITFSPESTKSIYRENIENLWNSLLTTGTISIIDVRNELLDEELSNRLMDLMSELSYVHQVRLRPRHSSVGLRALRYMPPANTVHIMKPEIIL
ncbi:MAG: macro domain-containing protein [Deltaproteobacteria bacterium]|nr:macro domain-containing protein [Deltaproteobacteria bacterium]